MWKELAPLTIAILSIIATAAGQWAVLRSKIQAMEKVIDELRTSLTTHTLRTEIHVDPMRDQERWSHLMNIVDRIDKRLDRLFQGQTYKECTDA